MQSIYFSISIFPSRFPFPFFDFRFRLGPLRKPLLWWSILLKDCYYYCLYFKAYGPNRFHFLLMVIKTQRPLKHLVSGGFFTPTLSLGNCGYQTDNENDLSD